MPHLSLSLLGPFLAVLDGQPITHFESNKVRALLAYLAVEADRPHRRETLASLLWPDFTDRAAHTNLRHTLSRLRYAIGDRARSDERARSSEREADPPFLLVNRETIQFNRASDHWLDVAAFGTLAASSRQTSADVHQLQKAVALYRGAFLEGFSIKDSTLYEDWALITRERLQRRAMSVLDQMVTGLEQRGEYGQACEYAWKQVELEPWYEEGYRRLIRLLALDGQRSAALAQYEACVRALREELDVAPEAETTALYERIRDGGELTIPDVFSPHNLAAQWTPFIGREDELAEISQLLADPACRLLSLVGLGGSGKTRLALEAATAQLHAYEHGVYWVSLASLKSSDAVPAAIARAIGFALSGGRDPMQRLLDYMRRKQMLLILDNCEHLLASPPSGGIEGGITCIAAAILRAAPKVTLIATSRARLNVPGEHLVPVGEMAYPDQTSDVSQITDSWDRYPALALFAQSARRVHPGFDLGASNLEAVARICRLVQGLPLAILLSAAWTRILSPSEIADEIERGIDFLSTDWREVESRHSSVRAVFDHSWSLLSEHERTVLAGLSVFRGGCTRQAAQQVSGASLRDLMALVNHSLLQRLPSGRFEMHELLHQYAAEQLAKSPDDAAAARDRHSTYYAALSEQWETDLKGARQLAALEEMDLEIGNVQVAWDWLVEQGNVAQLDRVFSALWRYADWRDRLHYAGWFAALAQRLSQVVDQATTSDNHASGPADRVKALRLQAKLWVAQTYLGDPLGKRAQGARHSLSILARSELCDQDVRAEKAFALFSLALIERNVQAAEQSLALYRELGDAWGTVFMLCTLCYCIPDTAAGYDRARPLYQEALSIARAQGNLMNAAHASNGLANCLLNQGALDEAEQLGRQALDLFQRIGDRMRMAWAHDVLGVVAMIKGQFAEARSLMVEGARFYEDIGDVGGMAQAAFWLGTSEMHLGQFDQARRCGERVLARASEAEGDRIHAHLLLSSVALAEGAYDRAQMLLQGWDPTAYLHQNLRHDLDHLPAILTCALRGLGKFDQARDHLLTALRLVPDTRIFWPLLYALATYALLLIDEGETEQAVEFYALASRYPLVANSRWFEPIAGQHIAAVAATLPTDVVAAAQERGRARDLDVTVKELLVALETE
ncbi:MAG: tetratricopeptide repeat protein [Anaerolineae bacterium]|nr:tetratricopeptide repeat protein [Anaerolineae bacterium]